MYVQMYLQRRGDSVSRMSEKTGDKEEIQRKPARTQWSGKNDVHKIPLGVLLYEMNAAKLL